jgi:hypothetical protein
MLGTGITEKHWQGGGFDVTLPDPVDTINLRKFCSWRSTVWVDTLTMIEIMEKTCPEYNGFSAQALADYASELANVQWQIAREGSVCLYGSMDTPKKLNTEKLSQIFRDLAADELDYFQDDMFFRVWWD